MRRRVREYAARSALRREYHGLTGERVNPRGCVANERPILADNGALRKRAFLRRRQNVRIELAAFGWDVLFLNECLQMRAKLAAGVRSHAATDADG